MRWLLQELPIRYFKFRDCSMLMRFTHLKVLFVPCSFVIDLILNLHKNNDFVSIDLIEFRFNIKGGGTKFEDR